MAYEIIEETINFVAGSATVVLRDKDNKSHIHINVPVPTPGDQTESDLRSHVRGAAEEALRNALAVLETN